MSWGNLTIITWTSQKSKLHPRPRSYQGSYIDAMDQSQPLDPVSKVLRGYLKETFRLSKKDMFLFTPGRLVALKTPFPCSVSNPFSRVPSLKHVQCIRAQDWFRHDKWVTFTDQSLPDWFTTFSLKNHFACKNVFQYFILWIVYRDYVWLLPHVFQSLAILPKTAL